LCRIASRFVWSSSTVYLLIERVDVRIAAVNKGAALDDVGLVSGRGVAKGAGPGLNDVSECLLCVSFDEGGPLDRPQLHPDTDRLKVVEHGLADVGVGRVAVIITAIEALGETCLGEQLFGFSGS